jgi:hypothetical protein
MATGRDPNTDLYVKERIAFFEKKLRETVTGTDEEKEKQKQNRENYETALELYKNNKLPGIEGMYHLTFIQDGKIRDLDQLHGNSPYLTEVSVAEIVVLSLFC